MKLEIKNLHASLNDSEKKTEIIKGISFELNKSGIYVLMGPNGSGKSTLANILMGSPKYSIGAGEIFLDGENISNIKVNERAKKGLFLLFQYPQEISGVTIKSFLRNAYNSLHENSKLSILEFNKLLKEKENILNVSDEMLNRYLNEGFSGGEKKKSEMLQLLVLNPQVAILDETDSGLDIDSLKSVADGINSFSKNKDKIILIITHYKRILDYLDVEKVFVMKNGKIIKEGGKDVIDTLEKEGYKIFNDSAKVN